MADRAAGGESSARRPRRLPSRSRSGWRCPVAGEEVDRHRAAALHQVEVERLQWAVPVMVKLDTAGGSPTGMPVTACGQLGGDRRHVEAVGGRDPHPEGAVQVRLAPGVGDVVVFGAVIEDPALGEELAAGGGAVGRILELPAPAGGVRGGGARSGPGRRPGWWRRSAVPMNARAPSAVRVIGRGEAGPASRWRCPRAARRRRWRCRPPSPASKMPRAATRLWAASRRWRESVCQLRVSPDSKPSTKISGPSVTPAVFQARLVWLPPGHLLAEGVVHPPAVGERRLAADVGGEGQQGADRIDAGHRAARRHIHGGDLRPRLEHGDGGAILGQGGAAGADGLERPHLDAPGGAAAGIRTAAR